MNAVSDEKPLGIALVGAGMVSDVHARSITELPGTTLAMVYSRTEGRAAALAGKYNVPWTTDLDVVLREPGIDALLITTAPHCHASQAIAGLQAGKHVLVEKPMAVSTAECDRMIVVAQQSCKALGVIFQSRFKLGVRRAKEFVDAGRLGRLLHLSGAVKWHRPQSYFDANDWRGRIATEGGGVIFSQAGHTLDLMRWIGGPVTWVFANIVTAAVHRDLEIENLGIVSMRFANGATGVLEASTALFPGSPERLEIYGTRGAIALEGPSIARWDIKDPGPGDEQGNIAKESGSGAAEPMAVPITWHKAQIADFVDAIRMGRAPAVDGYEARRLNVMCDAIYESARELRVVPVREQARHE